MAEHSPTLVTLVGPPAVGKMTVGQALCRRTGYKLFHGHVVADVLTPFFPFGTQELTRLADAWRRLFFEEAFQAGLSVVTTVAWRFDVPADADTIWSWLQPYAEGGGRALCVELQAPLATRLERNRTASRRRQKNAYWVTDTYLRDIEAAHRYDSGGTLPLDLPLLRIDTEHSEPEDSAQRICAHFHLPVIAND